MVKLVRQEDITNLTVYTLNESFKINAAKSDRTERIKRQIHNYSWTRRVLTQ